MNRLTLVTLVLGHAAIAFGQVPAAQSCAPSIQELKNIVTQSVAKHYSPQHVVATVDRAIGLGSPSRSILFVTSGRTLFLGVQGPAQAYRSALEEAFRRGQPTDGVTVSPDVMVVVWPRTITAPNIVKVMLERDGVAIVPRTNTLRPTQLATAFGGNAVLSRGIVTFPCTAFMPNATVTLTAIPEHGRNIVKTFVPDELGFITGQTAPGLPRASMLVGRNVAAVKALLGEPDALAPARLKYTRKDTGDPVYIDVNRHHQVTAVSAPDALLSQISKK
jgi:hypothetical protein